MTRPYPRFLLLLALCILGVTLVLSPWPGGDLLSPASERGAAPGAGAPGLSILAHLLESDPVGSSPGETSTTLPGEVTGRVPAPPPSAPKKRDHRDYLWGIVLDERGLGVPGAEVALSAVGRRKIFEGQTDGQGVFELKFPGRGDGVLCASHPAHGRARVNLSRITRQTRLVLRSRGVIAGTAFQTGGRPWPGAAMYATACDGAGESLEQAEWIEILASSEGRFRFANLDPGWYRIELEEETCSQVVPVGTTGLRLESEACLVRAHALGPDGRPAAESGWDLKWSCHPIGTLSGSNPAPMFGSSIRSSRVTDSEFVFHLYGGGRFALVVTAERNGKQARAQAKVASAPGEQALTLPLELLAESGPIHLDVVREDGRPLEDWSARLVDPRDGLTVASFSDHRAASFLPAGDWLLVVRAGQRDGVCGATEPITLVPGRALRREVTCPTGTVLEVQLERAPDAEGRLPYRLSLWLRREGEPFDEPSCLVYSSGCGSYASFTLGCGDLHSVYPALAPGTYDLRVEGEDWRGERLGLAVAGPTMEVVIPIRR